jgi:hypothetical protein
MLSRVTTSTLPPAKDAVYMEPTCVVFWYKRNLKRILRWIYYNVWKPHFRLPSYIQSNTFSLRFNLHNLEIRKYS